VGMRMQCLLLTP